MEKDSTACQLDREEYASLRRAIAARGQLRTVLFVAGLAAWASVLIAILVTLPYPLVSIVPLTLLASVFEAIRPLHMGAERIGRYLQVFYEERGAADRPLAETPAWERSAMAFGAAVPGAAGHPLFAPLFAVATLVNFLSVWLPGPVPVELTVLAVPHLAFLIWIVVADRAMRTQRMRDLARYRELRGEENETRRHEGRTTS